MGFLIYGATPTDVELAVGITSKRRYFPRQLKAVVGINSVLFLKWDHGAP